MMASRITSVGPKLPTNQRFGLFFAALLLVLAAYAHWREFELVSTPAFISSALFALLALFSPQLLGPLNRLWYDFGLLLGSIVSPIVLGAIFFLIITPVALVARLFGRDELKITRRPVDSYWVARSPPGPSSDSFKNQY
jgi:hypothetical protein